MAGPRAGGRPEASLGARGLSIGCFDCWWPIGKVRLANLRHHWAPVSLRGQRFWAIGTVDSSMAIENFVIGCVDGLSRSGCRALTEGFA
jgi:hypothetical protein